MGASKLPVDTLPDVTNNQVQVITRAPTLAAQEVEQFITYPVERAMSNVQGIEEMRSFSRFGLSVITVVFKEDMDIYFARQLISEKLKEAVEQIPKGMGNRKWACYNRARQKYTSMLSIQKKGSRSKIFCYGLKNHAGLDCRSPVNQYCRCGRSFRVRWHKQTIWSSCKPGQA